MTKKTLWDPAKKETGLTKYINFLKKNRLYKFVNYEMLHNWSVDNKDLFWKSIWDFSNVVGEYAEPVIKNEDSFIDTKFFINSKLNFTKNILSKENNENAVVFYSEMGHKRSISWGGLKNKTNKY